VLAGRLVADLTGGTDVVGREKRTDHELAWPDGFNRASDLRNDAAILVSHRGWLSGWLDATIRPQIGPAYACGGDLYDRIGRFDDGWRFALFEAHIPRPVKNCASHNFLRLLQRMMKPPSTEMDWPVT
jgi:hypothetical protein